VDKNEKNVKSGPFSAQNPNSVPKYTYFELGIQNQFLNLLFHVYFCFPMQLRSFLVFSMVLECAISADKAQVIAIN
jgi:hypothetical protein